MSAAIRVVLADDHELVRAGIRALLQRCPDIEIVAEVSDGASAVDVALRLRPQVVLMDIFMPSLNGIEAASRIAKQPSGPKTIMLSMNAAEEYVLHALRAGASGYVLKDASPTELEAAVRAVARGETYLSGAISRHVIDAYLKRAAADSPLERLTARQREILQLVAEGNSSKDIARKLGVSVKTVETHRTQIMQALDIHDVAGLVRYAIRVGLISSDR